MMKRFLIFILIIILSISVVIGVVLAKNNEKEDEASIKNENVIKEVQNNKEEPINVVLESNEEEIEEAKKENEIVSEENRQEINQEEKQATTSNINQSNKQNSNNYSKSNIPENNNSSSQANVETKNIPQNEQTNTDKAKVETPNKEESKPVENKPVETPKQTTQIKEYRENKTYINKLKNTIITEVTNNLSKLEKYGIKDVSQFKINVDSSICACYGGHRNGWTYENITAYNTFKSSILKGTSMRIYAVDEYCNGQYRQTLCYYGH